MITLPTSAVSTTGTSESVTVKPKSGSETTRTITIGLRGDNAVEITAGLSVGDQVVITSSASTGTGTAGGFGGLGGLVASVAAVRWRRADDAAAGRSRAAHPVIAIRDITKIYGEGDVPVARARAASASTSTPVSTSRSWARRGAARARSCTSSAVSTSDRPAGTSSTAWTCRSSTTSRSSVVRNRKIGFVFQSFNLIPRTTALANVELPLVYANVAKAERQERAMAALRTVGLGDRAEHFPNQLSGGQQQRVALARAIVTDPAIILADEPTGALDSASTAEVLELFQGLNDEGRTVVVITHEHDVAARARRVIRLRDGSVVEDTAIHALARRGRAGGLPDDPVERRHRAARHRREQAALRAHDARHPDRRRVGDPGGRGRQRLGRRDPGEPRGTGLEHADRACRRLRVRCPGRHAEPAVLDHRQRRERAREQGATHPTSRRSSRRST